MEDICGLETKYLINRDDSEEKLGSYEGLSRFIYDVAVGISIPESYPGEHRLPFASISIFTWCTQQKIFPCIDCLCESMLRQYIY